MQADTFTRALRTAVVGVGLVLLLAIVAAATGAGFGHGSGHGTVSHALVSYGMTAFLIVLLCLIPVAIYLRVMQLRDNLDERPSSLQRNLRGFAGIAAAFLFAYFFHKVWPHLHVQRHGAPKIPSTPQAGKGKLKLHHAATSSPPSFEWPLLWAALAVVMTVSGFVVYRMSRRKPPPLEPLALGLEQDLAATIGDAIDDLEREPDARRAVIAAYARMEALLGRHGLQRRLSETPIEYLRRALNTLTLHGEAVARLTSLFERAKFSSHAIGDDAKHEAIASLREIRDGIA